MARKLWQVLTVVFFLCGFLLSDAKAHDAFQFLAPSNAKVKTYDDLIADAQLRISSWQKRVEKYPDQWLNYEHLANALLEKAQLTTDVKDFTLVEQALDKGLKLAPEGSGPMLAAAHFSYFIHRLDKAEDYLNKIEKRSIVSDSTPAAILVLRSDIAFHRGEYEKALSGYRRCENAVPGLCTTQLATYYSHTGGYSEAIALLRQALSETDEKNIQQRAWLNLQLGTIFLQLGKFNDAAKVLSEGEKILPGWWLLRERSAELLTAQKKWNEAIPVYEGIVKQVGLPQHMDALASCYQHIGKEQEAKEQIAKAEVLWQEQLKLFPESASAHALNHYLKFGNNADQASKLAQQNYKTRPGGEARLYLAQAYLKAKQNQEALKIIEDVLATPFRSVELLDTARKVYESVGNPKQAAEMQKAVLEIDPSYYS